MELNHSHLSDHAVFGGEDLGILELDTVLPVEHIRKNFILEQAMKAQRGSGGIAVLFF